MQSTQRLTAVQQRAVERLARSQECKCLECGSPDYIESGDTARLGIGHINVELFCTNPQHPTKVLALGKSFPLTFGQASRIGLAVPPGEPPPRRSPGETFPR